MVSPFVLSPQISVSVQAHPRSPLNEYGHTRCLFRSPTYQFLPLVRRTGAGGRTRILLRPAGRRIRERGRVPPQRLDARLVLEKGDETLVGSEGRRVGKGWVSTCKSR